VADGKIEVRPRPRRSLPKTDGPTFDNGPRSIIINKALALTIRSMSAGPVIREFRAGSTDERPGIANRHHLKASVPTFARSHKTKSSIGEDSHGTAVARGRSSRLVESVASNCRGPRRFSRLSGFLQMVSAPKGDSHPAEQRGLAPETLPETRLPAVDSQRHLGKGT